MSWVTTIENDGLEMLNSVISGASLTFTKAYAVGSVPDSGSPPTLVRLTCPILNVIRQDGYTLVTIRMEKDTPRSNEDYTGAFTLTSVYLYAKAGSGSEAIFCKSINDGNGIPFPAMSDNTDFKVDFGIPVALSNSAVISVTVDDSSCVSQGQFQTTVDSLESEIALLARRILMLERLNEESEEVPQENVISAVSAAGSQVTATILCNLSGARVICAAYSSEGQMLSSAAQDVTQAQTSYVFTVNSAFDCVKLFLLNSAGSFIHSYTYPDMEEAETVDDGGGTVTEPGETVTEADNP